MKLRRIVAPGLALFLIAAATLLGACSRGSEVPNVVGKQAADAVRTLQADGYVLGQTKKAVTSGVEPGVVVAQDPAAGSQLKQGEPVDLTVAAPLSEISVPGIVGKSAEEASAAIAGASLVPSAYPQYSDTVAAGVVIAQLPEAGAKVPPNSVVGYTVSKGKAPAKVKVPNITGMSSSDAATALKNAALVGKPENAYSDTIAKGIVIIQSPGAGASVSPNSTVLYTVSLGKPPATATVTVPNVVGKTESAATSALTGAGLTVSVSKAANSSVPAGSVISQMPPAGSKTVKGGVVGIVVSSGPPPSSAPSGVKVPSVVGQSASAAKSTLAGLGLVVQEIPAYSSSVPEGNVFKQSPAAGSTVPAGSEAFIAVSAPAPVQH